MISPELMLDLARNRQRELAAEANESRLIARRPRRRVAFRNRYVTA